MKKLMLLLLLGVCNVNSNDDVNLVSISDNYDRRDKDIMASDYERSVKIEQEQLAARILIGSIVFYIIKLDRDIDFIEKMVRGGLEELHKNGALSLTDLGAILDILKK